MEVGNREYCANLFQDMTAVIGGYLAGDAKAATETSHKRVEQKTKHI